MAFPPEQRTGEPVGAGYPGGTARDRVWHWWVLCVAISLVNVLIGFVLGVIVGAGSTGSVDEVGGYDQGYAEGYALGNAVMIPAIVTILFAIGKQFRNRRSLLKVFFWTSVVVFIIGIFRIAASIQPV